MEAHLITGKLTISDSTNHWRHSVYKKWIDCTAQHTKTGKKITNLREPRSRNAGKIVMLVVIPYIEGQQIEGAVIRIGLLTFDKHVVFWNEVSR